MPHDAENELLPVLYKRPVTELNIAVPPPEAPVWVVTATTVNGCACVNVFAVCKNAFTLAGNVMQIETVPHEIEKVGRLATVACVQSQAVPLQLVFPV